MSTLREVTEFRIIVYWDDIIVVLVKLWGRMIPDQFAQFIAHERAERQADRDNLQQDHAARQGILEDTNRRCSSE